MMKMIGAVTALLMVAGSGFASLNISYKNMGGMSATVLSVTQTVSVAVGDVVVLASGTNKKPSVAAISYSSSAGEAFVPVNPWGAGETTPNPAAWMSYAVMTTAGDVEFVSTASGASSTVNALYHLSSDVGSVGFVAGDSDTYLNLAFGESLTVNNTMEWAAEADYVDGDVAVLGVTSHLRALSGASENLTRDMLNNDQRFSASTNLTDATGYDVAWSFTNADADSRTSNGSFVTGAFAEVIPEPATLGLVALFGGGILFVRRRIRL